MTDAPPPRRPQDVRTGWRSGDAARGCSSVIAWGGGVAFVCAPLAMWLSGSGEHPASDVHYGRTFGRMLVAAAVGAETGFVLCVAALLILAHRKREPIGYRLALAGGLGLAVLPILIVVARKYV